MLRLLSFFCVIIRLTLCVDVPICIEIFQPAAIVDERFLSVAIDSSIIESKFKHINFDSPKLIALAKGLSKSAGKPEIFLRIGGSAADHIIFDPTTYILNATELTQLYKFADKLGWKLIFDLNVLFRNHDGSWDPTNAVELIEFIEANNFSIDYELGNEPDLFPRHLNITIPPEQLAKDFKTLRIILNKIINSRSMLIGPDVATLKRYNYFSNVLSNMSKDVLDAVSFHHYYSSSEDVTVSNFTSVKYLDEFLKYGLNALSIIRKSFSHFPHPPVWIGETSSTYGGGCKGLGESFAAGFLWLDKLGLAAQMNISVVIRQALKGGHCSLLKSNYDPSPDYWTSVLHKQLVGNVVLNLTGFLQYGRQVRVYAHCINRFGNHGYNPSSIVLMVLNLNPVENAHIKFAMKDWENSVADMYLFQPAYGKLSNDLVVLNGRLLEMINGTIFPKITPVHVGQPYVIPPLSYGFLVVIDVHVPACKVH